MKCPHCKVAVHSDFTQEAIRGGHHIGWEAEMVSLSFWVLWMMCPACRKPIVQLERKASNQLNATRSYVYPRGAQVAAADPAVPAELAGDFNEAGLILNDR